MKDKKDLNSTKMDQREKPPDSQKKFPPWHGCFCCVCCIRTVVWNISDMKNEGRI
jgi:hypothetical protein